MPDTPTLVVSHVPPVDPVPPAALVPLARPATVAHPGRGLAFNWACWSALTQRAWRLSLRNPEGIITALALPVMLMLMFVYLFGGAIHTGLRYVDYVVPGVLLVCAGFGAGSTAVSVAQDLTGNVMDRFRAMGVPSQSVLGGQVIASVLRNLASTGLVIAVAFLVGFRSSADALDWLAALGSLGLFIVALTWLGAALGTLAGSAEAANGIAFMVSFLAYPSSAFVPVRTMPPWLQPFANHQPVTLVVNTVRDLLDGAAGAAGSQAWQAGLWSVGVIVVCGGVAGMLFTRHGEGA